MNSRLVDVHVHFLHDRCGRGDWRERNDSRMRAAASVGVSHQVASVLGSWGHSSPTYFPSPADLDYGNEWLSRWCREYRGQVWGYVTVNPNYSEHAVASIAHGASSGMVGVKLAASRRCTDQLLDPVCRAAAELGLPILHHVWQHRRREWPGQEASDGAELALLAQKHPDCSFILAHIAGGGDWHHTLRAIGTSDNVYLDLSGSGVDGGMLEACLAAVGHQRILWGTDLTIDTGWAKLRYLETLLPEDRLAAIRWGNAFELFRFEDAGR